MWVKAKDGSLVNLKVVGNVFIYENSNKKNYAVMVDGWAQDNFITLKEYASVEEAQSYVDKLGEKLGVEEI